MNIRDRIDELALVFFHPDRYGFRGKDELRAFVEFELGSLDEWETTRRMFRGRLKLVPPQSIYVICASNLAVSAEMALLFGLILGARVYLKLPAAGLGELERMVERLPQPFLGMVSMLKAHDADLMRGCDAVMAFGSDATVAHIHGEVHWRQRYLPYGDRFSAGLVPQGVTDWKRWAHAAAGEVVAYDQSGCLSPQAYIVEEPAALEEFSHELSAQLEKWEGAMPKRELSWEESAHLRVARLEALSRGDVLYQSTGGKGWTVAANSKGKLAPGPGLRMVYTLSGDVGELLLPWKGHISSISIATDAGWEPWVKLGLAVGASRICRMGHLQKPPLSWHHDGRPRLADLVTWLTLDE